MSAMCQMSFPFKEKVIFYFFLSLFGQADDIVLSDGSTSVHLEKE